MKTNLDILREKISAAVPEIVELKFGLGIRYKGVKGILCTVGNKTDRWNIHLKGNASAKNVDIRDEEFEIIGREITIADVIWALFSEKSVFTISILSNDEILIYFEEAPQKTIKWHLSLPLDGQSPETLQFLVDIFK